MQSNLVRLFTDKSSHLTEYCYMHFNNYYVEHIRRDMRWGAGSSRKYWVKKGGHLLFNIWSAGGA